MNRDTIIDVLRLLKSKKLYREYSMLRISTSLLRDKCKCTNPTIFEFDFEKNHKLVIPRFIKKGSVTIFWENFRKSRDPSNIENYENDSSYSLSLSHKYKKGKHKIFIFRERRTTILSSDNIEFGKRMKYMINFIKLGDGLVNLSNFFMENLNSVKIHLNHLDLSHVINTSGMFFMVKSFNNTIEDWDVSNVKNMSEMFSCNTDCATSILCGSPDHTNLPSQEPCFFNQYIGDWDTSNVVDMSGMFLGARSFNQQIGDWNTLNVTNMSCMFYEAKSFNQPIGNWNVSKVTNMAFMFFRAFLFDQPIGNWNVSNVGNMCAMFGLATSFNQQIGDWNVSNVRKMENIFCGAKSFNKYIGNWNISDDTRPNLMISSDICQTNPNQIMWMVLASPYASWM